MHVLIAEDQPDVRDMLTLAFRMKGHRVTVAYNGAEAVQAVVTPHPGSGSTGTMAPVDAVLMDCQMPVMDGLTATRCIRELPQAHTLPILLVTAYHYTEVEAYTAGANGLVRKPILPMELVAQIEALVQLAARDGKPA